jgi:glutathione S-transferase
MLRLHHFPLCPFCRKVRVVLHEKEEHPELEAVEPWHHQRELAVLNPAAEVPVLEDRGRVICDSWAICEYLDETRPEPGLLGKSLMERAEIRRLVAWFDTKFVREVTDLLWGEKLIKRIKGSAPNSAAVRNGLVNIHAHLDYIGFLFDRRNWLAGDALSLADIAAAAQLSVLDYLGDVPWGDHEGARVWYARIKSRPSFRPLLQDRLPGLKPAPQYDNLDF